MDLARGAPNLTYDEIGQLFGITRQRVSQIIKRERKNGQNL